jgi:hypothetical protein
MGWSLDSMYFRRSEGRAMSTRNFPALVKDGQLSFGESLADLEGQCVVVTLAPMEDGGDAERVGELLPPDWLDIEKSIVFQLPYRWEPVQADVIEAGAIHPTIVLPQGISDE